MALNISVFKTRALSAAVFVAVMLAGLLLHPWSFLLLFSIIHIGCWIEYIRLVEKITGATVHRYLVGGLVLAGFGILLAFCGPVFSIGPYWISQALCLPLALAGFLLMVLGIFQQRAISPRLLGLCLLGFLYLSFAWGTMIGLRQHGMVLQNNTLVADQGLVIPLTLIAAIWINDTMQYLVGSLIGKTPFSKISPKKTWEGTVGGSLLAIVVVGFFCTAVLHHPPLQAFGVAAIAAVVGTLGDLLESFIKRSAGVKDSGQMLPGHGGFLDRFDSMLLATPVVWLFVQWFL